MHKTKHGYRHRQFDIERWETTGLARDTNRTGWGVWLQGHGRIARGFGLGGVPHRTLRDAVENIDQALAADLRCPHCDLWIGDQQWPGLPSVDHDLQACNDKQLDLARRDTYDTDNRRLPRREFFF